MVKLPELPPLPVIQSHRGTLDYYVWRGIPVARSWPRKYEGPHPPDQQAQITAFSDLMTRLTMTAPSIVQATHEMTKTSAWTWRDMVATAIAGNLNSSE